MPDSSDTIRIGIVGCGRASEIHHLPTLAEFPEFTVTALADTDTARCSELAKRFSIPGQFSCHGDLLGNADVDAVVVATPPASHAEIGLDVLEAGKHMFMEKPLAMNLEECDRLIDAAARSESKILVSFNLRWHRLATRARDMIRSGQLGPLKAIRSVYTHAHLGPIDQTWHRTRALGGGVMFNDGVHHFDLWRYLLDLEITQVQAATVHSTHFEDDTCTVSARLEEDVLAAAVFSFSTSSNSEVEIFGEYGSLLLSMYRFDGLIFSSYESFPGSIGTRVHRALNTLKSLPSGIASMRRGGDFDISYTNMWRHFVDCINHAASPACTLGDGRAATAAALACQESMSSGRAVTVP